MNEARRVGAGREREVEERVYQFNKMKEEIYAKAKEEAIKEEKKRMDKYLQKMERVKQ